MIISEIDSGQIDGLWNRYNQVLQEFVSRWQNDIDWKPEDIKNAIKKNTGRMVNIYDREEQIAFMIYRHFNEEFSGKKYLHIWLFYIYPKHRGRLKEVLSVCCSYLDKVKNKVGAKYIEMDSPRKGWERVMKRYSMIPKRVVYRRGGV